MLTKLTISNFRNIESLTLDHMGRITLIGGRNGVGKTAVLEALWLLSGPDTPELCGRMSAMRGLGTVGRDYLFKDIFRDFDTDHKVCAMMWGDWGSDARSLEISMKERRRIDEFRPTNLTPGNAEQFSTSATEDDRELVFSYVHDDSEEYVSRAWWVVEQASPGPFGLPFTGQSIRQERQVVPDRASSVFLPALYRDDPQTTANRLGRLQLQADDAKILNLVRLVEPRLERLAVIPIENSSIIHGYLRDRARPIPVHLLGEGLNRMLALGLALFEVSGGLLLVDEIENGLHYRSQEGVFSTLYDLAEELDVQIVATTHSGECIRAAHLSRQEGNEKAFTYYRLDRRGQDVIPVRYDSEMLDTVIKHNMGIR